MTDDVVDVEERLNRDDRGRYLRGHALPGPGRPRGVDLRHLAETKAQQSGVDLPSEMWNVVRTVIEAAKAGDMAAARLLFDRLCTGDDAALQSIVLNVVSGIGITRPETL